MNRLIIIFALIASACTQPSIDGVYVINKEKLKHNITKAKDYIANRESERILRDIDNSELALIIKADSVQFISSGQTPELNNLRYRLTPTKSGVKFTTKDREIIFEKTDSCYLLSIQGIPGTISLPPERVEFVKVDRKDADKYLANSPNNGASKIDQMAVNDLAKWTGTYMYPSGQLLMIDVNGNTITGKTDDGKDGNVTLTDGKVKIDGEEAFLKNDTIFYSLHGAGSSNEVILVKRLNDMH